MIKVLEHGVKKVTCPNCKAKLQYEQEDISEGTKDVTNIPFLDVGQIYEFIICPDCGEKIMLTPIRR